MALKVRVVGVIIAMWIALTLGAFAGIPKNSPIPTPAGAPIPNQVRIVVNSDKGVGKDKSIKSGNSTNNNTKDAVSTASANVRTITFVYKNKKFTIPACPVGEGEYLLRADERELGNLAKTFDSSLHWDKRHGLVVKCDGKKYNFPLDADTLPAQVGGRRLNNVGCYIDGNPYMPAIAIGDLLGVGFTVNPDGRTGWVDATVSDVHLEWNGESQSLVVQADHDVSYTTFALKNPERFVIDIIGGVLDIPNASLRHPRLGKIRIGQNSLTPAKMRIVIPMQPAFSVSKPATKSGRKFVFPINNNSGIGPATSSPRLSEQRLLKADVTKKGSNSVINLKFSGPVRYEWCRLIAPDHRFFVDLPDVILAGAKQEISVRNREVRAVRISQNSRHPQAKTRVVVDMASPLKIEVKPGTDSNSLAIEIFNHTVGQNSQLLTGSGSIGTIGSTSSSSTDGKNVPIAIYQPSPSYSGSGVRTICIDAGHGGTDSGAYNRSLRLAEEDVTLDVAIRLAEILVRNGWKIVMTRNEDRDVSYAGSPDTEELWARAKVSNDNNADVFISLHCNAAASTTAAGTSVHVFKDSDQALGNELITPLVNHTERNNRGVHQDRFYVLAHTNMPAVLVEMAFISNPEEGRLLGEPSFRQRIAEGLAEGLNNYAARYLAGKTAAVPSSIAPIPPKRTYITTKPVRSERNTHAVDDVLPQAVLK